MTYIGTATTDNLPSEPSDNDNRTVVSFTLRSLGESLFGNSTVVLNEIDASTFEHTHRDLESSTVQQKTIDGLETEVRTLFFSAREEIFEDGMESEFSRRLERFITLYGHTGMETIIVVALSKRVNAEVVSETMRIIGRLDHERTYRDRLWLLGHGLHSPTARIRDGAILGLASLDDPIAIDPLKAAIARESSPELRRDMEQVLSQLEETRQ